MRKYIVFIRGPTEEFGDVWIIAPSKYPGIRAIGRKKMIWPIDIALFKGIAIERIWTLILCLRFAPESPFEFAGLALQSCRIQRFFGTGSPCPSIPRMTLQAMNKKDAKSTLSELYESNPADR